jgi:DNA-binding CsgD family transcriptional regulator
MNHLTRNDYAEALRLLQRMEVQAGSVEAFVRAVILALNDYVPSELITLSVIDLRGGRRRVLEWPDVALGVDTGAGGEPHFFSHPLLRRHGLDRARVMADGPHDTCWLDNLRSTLFGAAPRRESAYAAVVPLYLDRRMLAGLVLNRRGLDFSERDHARLELLRPHLAFLYCHACRTAENRSELSGGAPAPLVPPSLGSSSAGVTKRECEILRWLASGKTDDEIAALLAISPRTVHKHLEHIYVKLGVETRTAAVMRALTVRGLKLAAAPPAAASGAALSRRP